MRYLLVLISLAAMIYGIGNVDAKSTFLPDWQETDFGTDNSNDFNKDENYCKEALGNDGTPFYHKASGCPAPKIFDEYCPTDDGYISDCYCPEEYNLSCDAPLRGNSTYSCDGLWASCCDTTCPPGTSRTNPGGCGGSTSNGCGDACYYPYKACCQPIASVDPKVCSCGATTCGDGCGGVRTCCDSCASNDSSSDDSNSSGSGNSDQKNDGGCKRTCPSKYYLNFNSCARGAYTCSDDCGTWYACKGAVNPVEGNIVREDEFQDGKFEESWLSQQWK